MTEANDHLQPVTGSRYISFIEINFSSSTLFVIAIKINFYSSFENKFLINTKLLFHISVHKKIVNSKLTRNEILENTVSEMCRK